jgi:hypothetical protein
MSSANNKRSHSDSGASGDKRQKTSGEKSDSFDSTISEALPEIFAGLPNLQRHCPNFLETNESDSDRRGREKKEREQKKTEDAAERERQGNAKGAASRSKPCLANIGGKRVKKNGIIEFEGGTDFQYLSRPIAEEATGILKKTIDGNIFKKGQSKGKKGIFKRSCLSMHLRYIEQSPLRARMTHLYSRPMQNDLDRHQVKSENNTYITNILFL